MAADERRPQRITIDYGDQPQPPKVNVKKHIRSGFKKIGGSVRDSLKRTRKQPEQASPELRAMAEDAETLAAILEKME